MRLPHALESLARLRREVQMRYSHSRHAVERGNGHLWQRPFYSCPLEPERLGSLMRYVELNPVRAGLAERAAQYRGSSASVHLGGAGFGGIRGTVGGESESKTESRRSRAAEEESGCDGSRWLRRNPINGRLSRFSPPVGTIGPH